MRDRAIEFRGRIHQLEAERMAFDQHYGPVLDALGSARAAKKTIRSLVSDHRGKIRSGFHRHVPGKSDQVSEAIDPALRHALSTFLTAGRWLFTSCSRLWRNTGSTSAMFSASCRTSRPGNVGCLPREVRNWRFSSARHGERWLAQFGGLRNKAVHETWRLADVGYVGLGTAEADVRGAVGRGSPVSEYVTITFTVSAHSWKTWSCAASTWHLMAGGSRRDPKGLSDGGCPRRFRIDLARPGVTPWRIGYSEDEFD